MNDPKVHPKNYGVLTVLRIHHLTTSNYGNKKSSKWRHARSKKQVWCMCEAMLLQLCLQGRDETDVGEVLHEAREER
jgi:hypothetical protein